MGCHRGREDLAPALSQEQRGGPGLELVDLERQNLGRARCMASDVLRELSLSVMLAIFDVSG